MTQLDLLSAEDVLTPIVKRCLRVAEANKPKQFAAWFCGGIIANVIAALPDAYWEEMKMPKPCGEVGCTCHLVEQDAMKFLATLRAQHKEFCAPSPRAE